jgi:LPXTG-motif cell wall-anchored protein
VRISLGAVRQASQAHAVAAKAAAIKVAISVGSGSDSGPEVQGHKGYRGSAIVAELGFGVLEAAAVAPEAPVSTDVPGSGVSGGGISGGGVSGGGVSGAGGGLPVTGPQAGLIALGGAGLLVAGGAALVLTRRRRRSI